MKQYTMQESVDLYKYQLELMSLLEWGKFDHELRQHYTDELSRISKINWEIMLYRCAKSYTNNHPEYSITRRVREILDSKILKELK